MKRHIAIGSAILLLAVWTAPIVQAEDTTSSSANQTVATDKPAKKPMRRLLMSGKKPAKKPAIAPVVSRVEDKVKKERSEKDRVYGWEKDRKDR